MTKLLPIVLFLGLITAGCGQRETAPPAHARLTVTSDPVGATVLVDDMEIGLTPLEHPINGGPHMLEVRMVGYDSVWQPLNTTPGQTSPHHVSLQPTTAWVQFLSSPPGAIVKVDGRDFGTTPLTTPLRTGEHIAEFRMSGTDAKTIEFKLTGSTPRRFYATLQSVLSTVTINSNPNGASIYIDDELRGTTPLTVEDVAPGRHDVVAKLVDHDDLTVSVVVRPNETKTIDLPAFTPLPGSLTIRSTPSGAQVYLGQSLQGNTPLTLNNLSERELALRLDLTGYEPVFQTVEVSPGRTREIDVVLEATFGGLMVSTNPPGCTILAQERKLGVTESDGDEYLSKPFEFNGLAEGPHTIIVTHPRYFPARRKVIILRNQVYQLDNIVLKKRWLPDHQLEKSNGEIVDVVLVNQLADGSIEVEPIKGVRLTYTKDEYTSLRPLKEESQ